MKVFSKVYTLLFLLLTSMLYAQEGVSIIPDSLLTRIEKKQANNRGVEVKSKRTNFSKTFINSETGKHTVVLSNGFMHYQDAGGEFHDINRRLMPVDSTHYGVREGMFYASFAKDLQEDWPFTVMTKDSSFIRWRLVSMVYFDQDKKSYKTVYKLNPSEPDVVGNCITYHNIFPGADLRLVYGDVEVKEEIVLSDEARKKLPTPESLSMKSEKTSIMFLAEMQNSEDIQAFSDVEIIVEKSYNTKKAIFFKNKSNKSRFIFPINFAFLAKDREDPFCETFELDKQFLYVDKSSFFLFGMSFNQFREIPQGDLVFDPTTIIQPDAAAGKDARFGYFTNGNYNYGVNYILQLHANNYNYYGGRTIIQYDLDQIPSNADIQSAQLNMYYYSDQNMYVYHNSADANIHQVSRSWVEGTGNCIYSNDGVTFNTYNGVSNWTNLGGDYNATVLDVVTFYKQDYKWMAFDLTSNVQDMVDGTTTNNGWIIKWAQDIYPNFSTSQGALFYSSDYTTDVSKRPYLEITYSVPSLASYDYDSIGRLSKVTYANGVEESYSYDTNRNWMSRKEYENNSNNVYDIDYTYDDVGNITSQVYAYAMEDNTTMNYDYNDLHQLDDFWISGQAHLAYAYDPNGNITSKEGTSFAYGTTNKLDSTGGLSFTYDAIGRVIGITESGSTDNMSYDLFSNMTAYNSNSYSYDSFNQRVYKDEDDVETYYITSGQVILAEYDGSDNLQAEYIYSGGNRICTFDPGQGHLWFYTDHLGSNRLMSNSSTKREYYPYGDFYTTVGDDEVGYEFSGKELDSGIGLYYFGSRYYHPGIGRWLVTDPAGQGFSPYIYCCNSPVVMVDPDGNFSVFGFLIGSYIGGAFFSGITGTRGFMNPANWDYSDPYLWASMITGGLAGGFNIPYDISYEYLAGGAGGAGGSYCLRAGLNNYDGGWPSLNFGGTASNDWGNGLVSDVSFNFFNGGLGTPHGSRSWQYDASFSVHYTYGRGYGSGDPMSIYTLNYNTQSAIRNTYGAWSITYGQIWTYNSATGEQTRQGMLGGRYGDVSLYYHNDHVGAPGFGGDTDQGWTAGYGIAVSHGGSSYLLAQEQFTGKGKGGPVEIIDDKLYYVQNPYQMSLNKADTILRVNGLGFTFSREPWGQNYVHDRANGGAGIPRFFYY